MPPPRSALRVFWGQTSFGRWWRELLDSMIAGLSKHPGPSSTTAGSCSARNTSHTVTRPNFAQKTVVISQSFPVAMSWLVFSVEYDRCSMASYLKIRVGPGPHPVTNPAPDPIVHKLMKMPNESQHEFVPYPLRNRRRFKYGVKDARTCPMVSHRDQVGY